VCDLSKRKQVARLADEALAAGASLLVANAAHPASGLLVDLTQQQIDLMLEVNLRAPIALARSLAPAMIERGSGHMVFISSLAGKAASPSSSVYSATKFGLRGFALGLREDLRAMVWGCQRSSPASFATPGCSPTRRWASLEGSGPRRPRTWPQR